MWTLRCQVGVLGLSLKLSRNIDYLPKGPCASPLKIFGGERHMFAPPSFQMGEQLLTLLPLFQRPFLDRWRASSC